MSFTVRLPRRVAKLLDRLPRDIQRRILGKLEMLEKDPRPLESEKLAGAGEFYRVRSGDWRVIYTVRDKELVVLVVRIGHRREVYR